MLFRSHLVAVIATLAVGCGSPAPTTGPTSIASPNAPPTAQPNEIVSDAAGDWTFDRPTTWISAQPNSFITLATGPLVYLTQLRSVSVTNLSVIACLNGPDLERSDLAVRAFLASVHSAPEPGAEYREACAKFNLSQRRCDYIVNWARAEAGLAESDPAAIELLGDPACPGELDAMSCGIARTTHFVVRVRVTPAAGEPSEHPVFCGILSETSLLCTEQPKIRIITPTTNGYWDVPCSGEAPENACATPLPSIDPGDAASAIPLTITGLAIPIDHPGDYSLDLGMVTLPNGVLTEAAVTLADDHPTKLLLNPGFLNLVLRSTETGEVIDNAYTHGWHMGTERVAVTLEFSVEQFESGTELVIADATVR